VKLRVGTRRSPLALTQTRQTMNELVRRCPELRYELVEIVTTGDRILDRPLRDAGGKGLFLKELDEALLLGRIDCAVHSLKDVPTDLAPGTVMAAVLERADVRDVLVTREGLALGALPDGAVIGTTSLRRQAQALAAVPRASIRLLRGNVETRIRKLGEGDCDATFLAAAGLSRLGFELAPDNAVGFPPGIAAGLAPVKGLVLDPFEFIPAPGQGAIAITARADDAATIETIAALDHEETRLAVLAERGFARVFGGGCHLPLAAYATRRGQDLTLVGLLVTPDGSRHIRDEIYADVGALAGDALTAHAEALGISLGESFLTRGARDIIDLAGSAEFHA
jgi:hydroxymethylbilane synthase